MAILYALNAALRSMGELHVAQQPLSSPGLGMLPEQSVEHADVVPPGRVSSERLEGHQRQHQHQRAHGDLAALPVELESHPSQGRDEPDRRQIEGALRQQHAGEEQEVGDR